MEHEIVDLGVPRSSRGGGTNKINSLSVGTVTPGGGQLPPDYHRQPRKADPAGRDPRAVLARIRLVCDAFAVERVAFPAMPPEDRAAALGMTVADVRWLTPVLAFAARWGVSVDWLLTGDMGALIRYATRGFAVEADR